MSSPIEALLTAKTKTKETIQISCPILSLVFKRKVFPLYR